MYSLLFRKGKIELNISCEDKDFISRQLEKIIKQASAEPVITQEQEFVEQNEPVLNVEQEAYTPEPVHDNNEETKPDEYETVTVKTPEFHHLTPEEIRIASERSSITINSLQNPPEESVKEPNFEQILNAEMNSDDNVTPVLKDDNFVQYVQSKSAIEKLDFLVITAQYLAKYENMNTFSLKHINSKLMQNFTLIVDHGVLQSAISKELITKIIDNPENSEYMLTEKGLRSY